MAAEQRADLGVRLKELRGMAVMLGPSVVLEGLVAAGAVACSAAAWERARVRRRPLWRLAALGALAPWAYRWLLRSRMLNWGATRQELGLTLPADELVAHPTLESTHAATFNARPEELWPWLAQLGEGRGGYYSFDWLERLAGASIHSAERLLPESQHLKEGDSLSASGEGGFVVRRVEPRRALVLGIPQSDDFSWAFVLQPLEGERTRLLMRMRVGVRHALIGELVIIPHFIMQWKMTQGLRRRAERTARERRAGSASDWPALESTPPGVGPPLAPRA
jgi:hypothetical protein